MLRASRPSASLWAAFPLLRVTALWSGAAWSGAAWSAAPWRTTLSRTAAFSVMAVTFALSVASSSQADTSARPLLQSAATRVFLEGSLSEGDAHQLVAIVDDRATAYQLGLSPIGQNVALATGSIEELLALATAPGVRSLRWAPARRFFLEQVDAQVHHQTGQDDYGVDGSGVVVGVVDTGIDVSHAAVRHPDGSTRVAWLLSYGQKPRGDYPELEEEFGCTGANRCAVFGAAEIDAALASGILGDLPSDKIGHGTHITSIAAGGDDFYRGVAAGADLVIVQVAGDSGATTDARILEGARFVFDRAAAMGQPAVVNLSLGSNFGAHDGTSSLEATLEEMGNQPGRAIVVAAGNDANMYLGLSEHYPEPFGSHTEVVVRPGTTVRVPILTPSTGYDTASGAFFVWASVAAEDEISVAFSNGRGVQTDFIGAGEVGGDQSLNFGDEDDYEVYLTNGVDDDLEVGITTGNIVLGLAGEWEDGRPFELVFRGNATLRLWLESSGDVGPSQTGTGVVFPRAQSAGTVSVPASSSGVIAVGASVNRNTWTDYTGEVVEYDLGEPGAWARFSGGGPNRRGDLRPDLLAPGANVVAAMARAADPRDEGNDASQFAAGGACYDDEIECFVVDDEYAVGIGTSMAAPVVTGAAALLLQRDPELDTSAVQQLLRAGTQPTKEPEYDMGRVGTGVLDVPALLAAQDLAAQAAGEAAVRPVPSAETSRFVAGASQLYPDPNHEIECAVVLRDADDLPAMGEGVEFYTLEIEGPASGEVRRLSSGLLALALWADDDAGDTEVRVRVLYDGAELVSAELPVQVDIGNARGGLELAGGTCALVPSRGVAGASLRSLGFWAFLLGALGLGAWRRRAAGH